MNKTWPLVPLGEVLTQVSDSHVVKADQKYPNFGIFSFGRGLFPKPPILGLESRATTLYRVRKSQFVYSRLFAFEGAYGLVAPEFDGHFVSNEYPVFECDQSRVEPRYILACFKRASVWEEVSKLSTGLGDRRRRIHPNQLLTHCIPLPPLPEQQRIVAKVEDLTARIEDSRRLKTESWEDSGILWKAGAELVIRALPSRHWQALSGVVDIRGGGTPSKDNPAFWNGTIPWVSPKDMKHREITKSEDHITDAALSGSAIRLHPVGVVLIVIRGMILAHTFPSAVLRVPATINQDMKALYPRNGLLPEYLCAVLWALNDDVMENVDRSSHDTRKLVTSKLQAMRVPVPNPSEQQRLVAHLNDLQSQVDALKALQTQSAAELDALLPSILDKAFKGEL